ncbi:MAG: hypothetical protein ACO1SX_21690 [Actinomycetota bacterium]
MRAHRPTLEGSPRASLVCAAALALLFASAPAGAVIKRLYPLADIIADADIILVAKVSARDRRVHRVTLSPTAALKGSAGRHRLTVALAGGDDKAQVPILEERLPPGRPVILFGKTKRFMLGYTNGTWFRIAEPQGKTPWQFVHLEVYLPRTFRGSTESLHQTVSAVLAGASKAPDPNPNIKPGYGPP